MQKFCISVDWLQTFNHAAPLEKEVYQDGHYTFQVHREDYSTQLFTDVFTVRHGNLVVATILQHPRSTAINARATMVKLSNRVLYSQKYIEYLYAINRAMNIEYKGITRLDLCYDCNTLHDGRDVGRFIRQYVCNEPFTPGHIIRRGSSAFTVHGSRNHTSIANMTSIRWGSPRNNITAYCYNKTLELLEVKDKPWIREMWKENGLESFTEDEKIQALAPKDRQKKTDNGELSQYLKKSVWRFEISIKSGGKDIIDMATGNLYRLSPKYLEHAPRIRNLFYIYAAKVFDFRINTGQTRTRDYPKLQIFENVPELTVKPYNVNRFHDTGRTDKICRNHLLKLMETYSDMSSWHNQSLSDTIQFLTELSGKKLAACQNENYARCLNQMRSYKFMKEEDSRYLAAVLAVGAAKKDICADFMYDYFMTVPAPTMDELQQAFADSIPDTTPPEYIW